jgi:hypothetical protein
MATQVSPQDRGKVLQTIYNNVVGNPSVYTTQKKIEQELGTTPADTIRGCLVFFTDLKYIEFKDKDQFRITAPGILYYENSFKK